VADITKEEDVQKLFNETIKEFGQLDVLVNNAGIYLPHDIRDETILKQFDNHFNSNVRPIIKLIHLSIPCLEKSKGNIVNTGSVVGIKPVFEAFKLLCRLLYSQI